MNVGPSPSSSSSENSEGANSATFPPATIIIIDPYPHYLPVFLVCCGVGVFVGLVVVLGVVFIRGRKRGPSGGSSRRPSSGRRGGWAWKVWPWCRMNGLATTPRENKLTLVS